MLYYDIMPNNFIFHSCFDDDENNEKILINLFPKVITQIILSFSDGIKKYKFGQLLFNGKIKLCDYSFDYVRFYKYDITNNKLMIYKDIKNDKKFIRLNYNALKMLRDERIITNN